MDASDENNGVDDEVQKENEFSEDFTEDIESEWNNDNDQTPIQQQQQFPIREGNAIKSIASARSIVRPASNANPLSAPPPQQALQEQLWVETKTNDGKSYFYHAVTRETTWNQPDGINIKILSQSEFEAYTKQMALTNKPPEQQQLSQPGQLPPQGMMPPNFMQNNLMPRGNFHHAPPFNANMPPFGMAPPFNPQWNPQFGPPPIDPAKIFDNKIDPKVLAKAAEWSEHRAPDGRPYYYNAQRGESVWERPQALKELDEARTAFMHQPPPHMQPPLLTQGNITFDPSGSMMKPGAPMNKQAEMAAAAAAEKEKKKREEMEKAKQAAKPQDKSRPISSTPIAGTPWCVVWTGDSRVFFYNPSTRTSVWERPEDLVGRADVDKAVNVIPDQLKIAPPAASEKEQEKEKEVSVSKAGIKREESEKSEEDDEEEDIPTKKSKVEELIATVPVKIQNAPPEKKVDVIKDPAVEAELKAAKERAMVPLEIRVKQFKEMLKEKEVSAFSTWEKELHKIVFDPRYLLLASKERKQVFEKYVKDRAEDERREKRNKMQKKKDEFRTLMEEANLQSRSSFSDFSTRYSRDERFRGIDKMREREILFNDFLSELRRKEKDEKHHKKEQIRKDFFEMLKERTEIDRHTHWMDIKKKLDQDSRYKIISDSILREDYFYEYIKILKDERKREKAKKKSEKKEKKKKSKDKDRSRSFTANDDSKIIEIEDDNPEEKKNEAEKSIADGKNNKSMEVDEVNKPNDDAMEIDKSDDGSDSEKDQEDGEHSGTDSETERSRKDRDRQARAEASIKEREKQVQKTLAEHLRDRDKERLHHKRDEAIRNFSALLADLVRNSDYTWKEVKKQLKKDHRYEIAEELDRDERERIFNEHINMLAKKKRDKFREMLDEINTLELTSSWKDVKKQIRDDPRFIKFGPSEKCEREYRDYLRDKGVGAKSAFKELLQECKLITHKSYDTYKENHNHLKEIEDILKNDKRYLVLDHMSRERTDTILDYFEEMKRKGVPVPITSQIEGSRARKK